MEPAFRPTLKQCVARLDEIALAIYRPADDFKLALKRRHARAEDAHILFALRGAILRVMELRAELVPFSLEELNLSVGDLTADEITNSAANVSQGWPR